MDRSLSQSALNDLYCNVNNAEISQVTESNLSIDHASDSALISKGAHGSYRAHDGVYNHRHTLDNLCCLYSRIRPRTSLRQRSCFRCIRTRKYSGHKTQHKMRIFIRLVFEYFNIEPLTVSLNSDSYSQGSGLASSSSYIISLIKAISLYKKFSRGQKWSNYFFLYIALLWFFGKL